MANGKLSRYTGSLTASQIAEGMNAASRNARRLADDARALFELARYPTAASLAILSIEESGKVSVLRHLAMAPDDATHKDIWRDYRNHRSKNVAWILPDLVAKGARDLESLRPAAQAGAKHTALLDNLKQIGLYTDCLGNAHWSEPETVIEKSLAQSLIHTADIFATCKVTTPKEIELWIAHMRPVHGAPLERMKEALQNWYRAMREAGLSEHDETSVRAFIEGASSRA